VKTARFGARFKCVSRRYFNFQDLQESLHAYRETFCRVCPSGYTTDKQGRQFTMELCSALSSQPTPHRQTVFCPSVC